MNKNEFQHYINKCYCNHIRQAGKLVKKEGNEEDEKITSEEEKL